MCFVKLTAYLHMPSPALLYHAISFLVDLLFIHVCLPSARAPAPQHGIYLHIQGKDSPFAWSSLVKDPLSWQWVPKLPKTLENNTLILDFAWGYLLIPIFIQLQFLSICISLATGTQYYCQLITLFMAWEKNDIVSKGNYIIEEYVPNVQLISNVLLVLGFNWSLISPNFSCSIRNEECYRYQFVSLCNIL